MTSGQDRLLVLCGSSFGHDPHSNTEVFSNAFLMITIIAIAAKLRMEELYRGAFYNDCRVGKQKDDEENIPHVFYLVLL